MGKKYIFNNDNTLYLRDIINVRKIAIKEKFEFFKFNDVVYFIDSNCNSHKTSI